MAKKVNSSFKELPKGELIVLSFRNNENKCYTVTENTDGKYFLYSQGSSSYTYLKSKADPLFPEVYPEL